MQSQTSPGDESTGTNAGVSTDDHALQSGQPIDPLVCPRGHHSIEINATRFSCETCRNQGRKQRNWDKADLVDLRKEEPPLAGDDA